MADLELEIGGLFSPDGILSATERLAREARVLAGEIFDAEPDVDAGFFADWSRFYADFSAWKATSTGWFSRVWNTTRDELTDFVARYAALQAQWSTAHPSTIALGAKVTASDSIGGAVERAGAAMGVALKDLGIGLAVVLGVALAGYVAYKAVQA